MIDIEVRLDLWCRNRDCENGQTFRAITLWDCWKFAREAGWRKRLEDVTCPACDAPRKIRVGVR